MTQDHSQYTEPAPEEEVLPPAENGAGAELPAAVTEELARLKTELLYAKAETENVRRRLEQQAEERGKYAVANFAREMLQVADNLHRALEVIPADTRAGDPQLAKLAEGVELTERVLQAALERQGIRRIGAMGSRFDPNLHQAMIEIEDPNHPTGTVVAEMQAGYTIHDRLLREAMVGVSKGGPKAAPGGEAGVDTTA